MKKSTFLLGCLLLCTSYAVADGRMNKVGSFPSPLLAKTQLSAPAKAPALALNTDKADGLKMWAITSVDYNNDPGFVYFRQYKPSSLTKTGVIKDRNEDQFWYIYQITGGTMYNGEFLGYLYKSYTYSQMPGAFVKINLEKGTYETLNDLSAVQDWEFIEDMAVNPKDNKLIAIARDTIINKNNSVTSSIGEVDPKTGEYTQIQNLGEYYWSIEYDNNGKLWAMRWVYKDGNIIGSRLVTLDPDNGYKETNECDLAKDGQPFKANGLNLIQFDRATGDLYLLTTQIDNSGNYGYQYLCKVNTDTGEMTSYGTFGYNDKGADFYIPSYTADAPDAPFRVSNLSSTFDDNGKVTLKWTNPTTTWNKEELTELAEVLVYRDGLDDANLVATLDGENKVGQEMTWTDNTAADGVHTYYIVPCRVKGVKGIPDSWDAYTGHDVPSQPTNVKLTKNSQTSLTLSWTAPETGEHDGWLDKSSLKYTITRHPDNTVVAKDYTQTTFTDDNLSDLQSYSYTITPSTADGEGTSVTSEAVLAGNALTTPYSTEFATEAEAAVWTAVDANNDGTKFVYRPSYGAGVPAGYTISTLSYGNNDDYVISPAITLKGGTKYRVKFSVYFNYKTEDYDPERHHTFRFTAGQGATAAAQTTVMHEETNFQNFNYHETAPFEMFFTPETDGQYNIAFDYTSSQVQDDITLTAASIEEVYGKDLAALSFTGSLSPVKGAESDYTVTVGNVGAEAADNYKVQIVRVDGDNQVVLGETEVNEKLAPEAKAEVKVTAKPDVEGKFDMAAKVVFNGDQNSANDLSATTAVDAAPEGTMPFNYVIHGEYDGTETRTPISFVKYYSQSECIYHADELSVKGDDVKIHRLALEYDTNSPVTDPFNVQIYLGTTTEDEFEEGAMNWTPLSDLTLVYEGEQTVLPGDNNMMIFNFSKPFKYDPTKNLVVTFCKAGYGSDETQWPARFHVFNNYYGDGFSLRSLRYENDNYPEANAGSGIDIASVPVLHLALTGATSGVTEVVVGKEGISFDGTTLSLNGIGATDVKVFDLTGRTVLAQGLNGGNTSLATNLRSGVYIVKATGSDGKVYTRKINVAR